MLEVLVAKRVGTLELALELSVGAETLLVAGPNGAGKSTLLRLLLGVTRPDRGRIALDGRILFDAHSDVPAEDRRLGYLPQDYALFPHLDALGNAAFGLAGTARRERRVRAAAWLERVGASDPARRCAGALWRGEGPRLALTRAVAG